MKNSEDESTKRRLRFSNGNINPLFHNELTSFKDHLNKIPSMSLEDSKFEQSSTGIAAISDSDLALDDSAIDIPTNNMLPDKGNTLRLEEKEMDAQSYAGSIPDIWEECNAENNGIYSHEKKHKKKLHKFEKKETKFQKISAKLTGVSNPTDSNIVEYDMDMYHEFMHRSTFKFTRGGRFKRRNNKNADGARRLICKNGDVNVTKAGIKKRRRQYLADIFTTMVDIQWRWNLLSFILAFVCSWFCFAGIWYALGNYHGDFDLENIKNIKKMKWRPCVMGVTGYSTALLFSIETQHTIGYGTRYTTDECPVGIFIMMLQSCFGVIIQAIMTGIVFAKLTRPKRRAETLMFSKTAVICKRDGQLCFIVRVGDMRKSHIIEAHCRAMMIRKKVTTEGEVLPFHEHDIDIGFDEGRDRIFLVWPVMLVHVIDEDSPFYDISKEDLVTEKFEVIVILEGIIESTGMTTQARTSYLPTEVKWGERFRKLVSFQKEDGAYEIDYSLFHETAPVSMLPYSAKQYDEMKSSSSSSSSSSSDEKEKASKKPMAKVLPQRMDNKLSPPSENKQSHLTNSPSNILQRTRSAMAATSASQQSQNHRKQLSLQNQSLQLQNNKQKLRHQTKPVQTDSKSSNIRYQNPVFHSNDPPHLALSPQVEKNTCENSTISPRKNKFKSTISLNTPPNKSEKQHKPSLANLDINRNSLPSHPSISPQIVIQPDSPTKTSLLSREPSIDLSNSETPNILDCSFKSDITDGRMCEKINDDSVKNMNPNLFNKSSVIRHSFKI